jgi:hypothetical protein
MAIKKRPTKSSLPKGKGTLVQPSTLSFRLAHARVHDFRIKDMIPGEDWKTEEDNLNFKLQFASGSTPNDKEVVVTINLVCELKSRKEDFCWLKASFWIFVKKSTDTSLETILREENNFRAQMHAIAYSTMRGILFEKGKGTILAEELLPTVSPSSLINTGEMPGHAYGELSSPD